MITTRIKVMLVLEEVEEDHVVDIDGVGWEATQGQSVVWISGEVPITVLDPETVKHLVDAAESVTLQNEEV